MKIITDFTNTKEHGIYIATRTFSANKINITTWQDSSNRILAGFKVGLTGIGGLGPSYTWYTGESQHTRGCVGYAFSPLEKMGTILTKVYDRRIKSVLYFSSEAWSSSPSFISLDRSVSQLTTHRLTHMAS